MDILHITIDEFNSNENMNLARILDKEIWKKIPSYNINSVMTFKHGTLIKFCGMIQDMPGPEYYAETFKVTDEITKTTSTKCGKYYEDLVANLSSTGLQCSSVALSNERYCYVVTSVPALNSWVQQVEKEPNESEIPKENYFNNFKRKFEEVTESVATSSKKIASVETCKKEQANGASVATYEEYVKNHPLGSDKVKVCHVTVYKDSDLIKLNDVYEFVGFLTLDQNDLYKPLNNFEDDQMVVDSNISENKILIPKIHAVHFKLLSHQNPLVKELRPNFSHMPTMRKELCNVLKQILLDDSIAAEYMLCHLVSGVYVRRDVMALGKLGVNFTNVPSFNELDYVQILYMFIELLVTKSHYLLLTLTNLNTLNIIPKKDYSSNSLTTGLLQLSKNTHLIVDETKLTEGQLQPQGLASIKLLAEAIRFQKVSYDFKYYPIEYECDIPFLIFSDRTSILPSDVQVPLNPDEASKTNFSNILTMVRYFFLKSELLNEIRKYLTEVRSVEYNISEEMQNFVQEEFIKMRQNTMVTEDDLHRLLVLSRLLAISEGNDGLTEKYWRQACELEEQRKSRLKK